MGLSFALKLLAPYCAVLVFWTVFHHAWACILVYHLLILFWSRWNVLRVTSGWNGRVFALVAIVFAAAGPVAYFLWPWMTCIPSDVWFDTYGLTGAARWLMIPYFALVHPTLEQAHWSPLRAHKRYGWLAHAAFAGYHALVLVSLMRTPWVVLAVGVLLMASEVWRRLERPSDGGLALPVVTHVLADSGLVIAAVLRSS